MSDRPRHGRTDNSSTGDRVGADIMTPRLEKKEPQIWKIPPESQLTMQLSRELNSKSGTWSYNVVNSGYSALCPAIPREEPGDVFAPSLHTLMSQLDAAVKQSSPSRNPEPACAGSKRRLEPKEDNCLTSDGSGNSAKSKSSMLRPRTFKTSSIRTSTQRRPDARLDEDMIEASSFQEELDESTFPISKKSKVSFGGSDVPLATLAGLRSPPGPASTYGEEDLAIRNQEPRHSAWPRALIVYPNLSEEFARGKGVRTTELKTDFQLRISDETRKDNSLMTPNEVTASSSVIDCEAKSKESRYGTLPVTLKRPELVSGVETLNKKVRRIADQTIPAFWPTAGHGCAGPVRDPDELDGTLRTRVVPSCESSQRPQVPALFEDSLVQDSQEDTESEDFPVFHSASIRVCAKGGDNLEHSYARRSFSPEGSCDLPVDNMVKSVAHRERTLYDKHPQKGRLDAQCSTDEDFRSLEGAKRGCGVRTGSLADPVHGHGAQITVDDFWPGTTKRGERRGRTSSNDRSTAVDLSFVPGYDTYGKPNFTEKIGRPGLAGCVYPKSAQRSGKSPEPELLSNVFQTGRGKPVQISSSSLSRVVSLFEDVCPGPETRADVSMPPKSMVRNKTSVSSSALADAHSLLSVRKNLYTHSLSAQDVDGPETSHVDEFPKIAVGSNTACLFQTGRGLPVHISAESIQRVQPIFATSEALPPAEAVRVPTPSIEDQSGRINLNPPRAQSSRPVRGRAYAPISGEVKVGAATIREFPETGATSAGAGVSRSDLFRTGRDTPVAISSAAMQKILRIFDDEALTPPPNREGVGAIAGQIEEEDNALPPSLPDAVYLLKAKTHERSIEPPPGFRNDFKSQLPVVQREVTKVNGKSLPTGVATNQPELVENSQPKSKLSPEEAALRERANYIRYQWDRIFDPRLGFSAETRTNSRSYAVEAGLSKSTAISRGTEEATPDLADFRQAEVRKELSPEASKWGFSFKGSSGRTLTISNAAKAKAEALLKLGPEFVTPPRFEARRPSFEFRAKATESGAPSLLNVEERRPSTSPVKQARNIDVAKTDSGGRGGLKPGFKAPRLLSPLPSLSDRRDYVGLHSASVPASRRSFILPTNLHYLHQKKTRLERGRLQMSEYFGGPPRPDTMTLSTLSKEVLSITADTAETYKIPDGGRSAGVDETWMMLKDLGADQRYASKGWVANHFKWIVWKLASYERKFPQQARLLKLSSVLNELQYRYDRELNGERSALKRVTERDASAGHTMVLCVSAIRSVKDIELFYEIWTEKGDNADGSKRKPPPAGVIEVTDGWYRLNAHIDAPLAGRIHSGKLKAGQKIVVCGATLEGLSDGLPPLQAFDHAFLCINSNGVRRARWDQRLGFCGTATPLAFKYITHDGGVIPHTYVAITRRYPILHREKLAGGGYVLRSERAEDRAAHAFDKRRAKVAEEAMQKVEDGDSSLDEGAKLFFALETAADPEGLMLGMTRTQLDAFAAFKARREESRQTATADLIRSALEVQGLATREVTPTFKVRVVGLNRKGEPGSNKDGLVTIWHASEELQEQLQEEKVFCVYGLRPSTKGSYHSFNSTRWQPVSESTLEKHFEFPYVPRVPLPISNLSEYMPCREFDVAGLVLLVTDPVARDIFRGRAKSQWVFMTDGSCAKGDAADAWEETQVLAIEVSWPEQAFVPFESSLVGSVVVVECSLTFVRPPRVDCCSLAMVGYCNLWLKHRDQSNRLWVAEASDRALHSSKMTSPAFRHLTGAACEVQKWAKLNAWNVDILQSDVEQLAVHFECTAREKWCLSTQRMYPSSGPYCSKKELLSMCIRVYPRTLDLDTQDPFA